MLILFVFGVLPFIYVLVVGFFDWNSFAADPTPLFSGLNNYRALVFDTGFLMSLWNTLKFGVFAVASEIVLGYLLAAALHARFPAQELLPHYPHAAADDRPGRGRRHLAADDGAGLRSGPYYLDRWFGIDF